MNFFIRVAMTGLAAYVLTQILGGIHMDDFISALIFAFVLALLNAVLRPILILLTIPITIFTLGLFLLVINALMILLVDNMLNSVRVDGFWWAMLFSILLTMVTSFLLSTIKNDKKQG